MIFFLHFFMWSHILFIYMMLAWVAELVDARDLKSLGPCGCTSSILVPGTNYKMAWHFLSAIFFGISISLLSLSTFPGNFNFVALSALNLNKHSIRTFEFSIYDSGGNYVLDNRLIQPSPLNSDVSEKLLPKQKKSSIR